MKLSTVAEAIAAEIDEPILAIRGKLTKCFKPISGEGAYGAWTLQNAELTDATGAIKILFSNRNEVPQDWRNHVVELRCGKGAKGSGYTGVKRTVDKKTKVDTLTVSDKAEVILFEAEHQPEPGQSAPPNGDAKAPGTPPDASQAQSKANIPAMPTEAPAGGRRSEAELLADGLAQMYQIANAQLAAITIVHNYLVPAVKERTGQQIDAQQEQGLVQNMLIQMYYQKGHWNFRQKAYSFNKQASAPPPSSPPAPRDEPTDAELDDLGSDQPF